MQSKLAQTTSSLRSIYVLCPAGSEAYLGPYKVSMMILHLPVKGQQ